MSQKFDPGEYRGYLRMLAQTKTLRIAAGKVDASDLVQECLLKAHERREQFSGREEPEYRAWLRAILGNVVLETARRYTAQSRFAVLEQSIHATIDESGKRLDELLVGRGAPPPARVVRNETIELALAALVHLPEDQQDAIRLHHLEQLSLVDVAETMERSTASVAGLLRRGLDCLRQALDSSTSDG